MKKRAETLAKNVAIYVGIAGAIGFNVWFWTSYTSKQRAKINGLERGIQASKVEIENLQREASKMKAEVEKAKEKIKAREDELSEYGDFLPSITTKPGVVRTILRTVEELGIKIVNISNNKLTGGSGGGYYTFTFGLELEGTYRDFKLLLSKIYKDERIIRIKKFLINEFDTANHFQKVSVEFETYFASS